MIPQIAKGQAVRVLFVVLVMVIYPWCLKAQEGGISKVSATESFGSQGQLKSLVRRYIDLNPSIAVSAAEERVGLLNLRLAGYQWLPGLSLSGQFLHSRSPLSTFGIPDLEGFADRNLYKTSLDLEQPIYLGGRVGTGYQIRKLSYQVARWEHRLNRQMVVADFVTQVIQFLSVDEQIKMIQKSQKTQKRFLELTQKNYKKGVAQAYELEQAEAESLSFVPRIDQLRQERQTLLNKLLVQLDMKEKDFRPQWSFQGLKGLPSQLSQKMLDLARNQNPNYQKSLLNEKLAQVQKKFDIGAYRSSVVLTGSWGFTNGRLDNLIGDSSEERSLVLNIKVPLFSRMSSFYTRKIGQERIIAAEKLRYEVDRGLKIQLEKSLLDYRSGLRRLKQTRAWDQKARQALASAEKSYRVGSVGSLQVHQLQKASEVAALSLVQAQGGLRLSELNYFTVMGEGEKYIGE